MGLNVRDRIQNAYNAFMNKDPTYYRNDYGSSSSYHPDKVRFTRGNERSIVTSIYSRIAIDAAQISMRHVVLDADGRYISDVDDGLNRCLTFEANIDQTGKHFIRDAVITMLDTGEVVMMPIETDVNPETNGSFEIKTMRNGVVTQWFPRHVKIKVYNERTGNKEEVVKGKRKVAIVENPFYAVMNEPNSTLQRLIRKLNLLDAIDEQSGSGKLDLIIQLPYVIKTDARKAQAESRRKDIETQLSGSKYGIAYTDGTEKITQLNRSVENNLLNQITYLTDMVYSQLGITQSILDGTADEKTFNNYYSRTIEPILSAIADELKRKFISQNALTRGHSIEFFRNPFKLVAATEMAELSDKLTRNEVLTSNEVRQIIGIKPSADPNADILRNKNINQSEEEMQSHIPVVPEEETLLEGGNSKWE